MKTKSHWESIGLCPHHGILVPLFSIRHQGKRGSFLDLIPLIDWCKKIGFDTIQILPLNDTGDDPSPYNPISSCALDPVYLTIPELDEEGDRAKIKEAKLHYLRRKFEKNPIDLTSFTQKHPWVKDYGEYLGDLPFHTYVQSLCFKQMTQVKEHAQKQGIFLFGDLTHLVSPASIDVAAHPHLFQTHLVAGAPPDKYNAFGQKWGFPLYDWEAMKKDHFRWWKEKLQTLSSLYHMYRIDHVVGLFRIWAIPEEKKATEGFFVPKEESLWMNHGREILEMMIEASPLLPIAEDLGTIPSGVYPILKELGICGTKVVRWQEGLPYSQYEPFSLTTLSTPDMEPIQILDPTITIEKRFEILRGAHSTSSYFHINLLQEYLRLFPELSWPNPTEDRINTPGTVSEKNWSFRFRPSLEELISHKMLAAAMNSIIT